MAETAGKQTRPERVEFRLMVDSESETVVTEMMAGLYREDPPQNPVDSENFRSTIRRFLDHRESGQVILFWMQDEIVGYTIIVPYWSNELGGTLAFVDELYVVPGARRRGIASAFLNHIREQRPFNAVAAMLEVSPDNARARQLYSAMGFQKRKNETLVLPLAEGCCRPQSTRDA
jgi:ribosomal protein S18 acetylase RimI-like enzyme